MAFVNEEVSEKDQERFDPDVFAHPLGGYPTKLYKWVIDRDRNVFIIRLGGDRPVASPDEGPKPKEYFAISWKGEVIKFEVYYSERGKYLDGNLVGAWEVLPLDIPEPFAKERLDIEEAVLSGLKVMGDRVGNAFRLSNTVVQFVHKEKAN